MKFIVALIIFAGLSIVSFFFIISIYNNIQADRQLKGNKGMDIRVIKDGIYRGNYEYVTLDINFQDGEIKTIEIIENRDSPYAKAAERVVENVIDSQMIDVDVISGATFTSEAILKAVEDGFIVATKNE